MVIMLADDIIIRKEDFGAILFHKKKGTMIEIDKEAYCFVRYIESEQIIDTSEWEPEAAGEELHLFIQHMMNEEVFIRLPAGILNKKRSAYRPVGGMAARESTDCLSAPETFVENVFNEWKNGEPEANEIAEMRKLIDANLHL